MARKAFFDALLLLVAMLFVGSSCLPTASTASSASRSATADGIVVLTGGVSRIDQAIKLLAAGAASALLITGVNRTTTVDELKEPRARAASLSTAASTSTGSPQHHRQRHRDQRVGGAATYGSIIVVTSNYHMPRALAELPASCRG